MLSQFGWRALLSAPKCWVTTARVPPKNGGKGIRTPDFQLAKLALYQLSYAPARMEDGRWKMRDCNPGSAGCQPASFGSLPRHTNDAGNPGPNPSAWRAPLCRRPKFWDTTARVPPGSRAKGNAGSRFTRDPAFSRVSNQTKTELCVTVVFFEL